MDLFLGKYKMNKLKETYQEIFQRPEDFRVKYNFYTFDEGGRQNLPYQHIRSNFWYEHPNHNTKGIFMIYPEFEDENGNIILDIDARVPKSSTARMWILSKEFRDYHRERITIGTKAYFMEGARKTAECEIIEIIGLLE